MKDRLIYRPPACGTSTNLRHAAVASVRHDVGMIEPGMKLFEGPAGEDASLVWLEPDGGGVVVRSESWGPGVERWFGSDGLETALHIGRAQLKVLAADLVADRPEIDSTAPAVEVLAAAYRGDSAATTHLRDRLEALGLAATFTMR